MSLRFPKNPNDGDEFNGFIHDAARGLWKVKFRPDPFASINIDNVQAGEAIVYDGTSWTTDKVSAAEVNVVTADQTSNTVDIDFSDNVPLEKITVAGDIAFTGSNYTAGVEKKILLVGDTVKRNLTFPQGWSFLNDTPAAVGADKNNILEISCFGTTEDSVFANFDGPSAFEPIVATGGLISDIDVNGISYRVHTFSSSSTFDVASVGSFPSIEYLVVGGGGGGGAGHGGGGGAGGYRINTGESSGGGSLSESAMSITPGAYSVIIGSGGASESSGSQSSFNNIIALGGGAGGGVNNGGASAGGSGGGGRGYPSGGASGASGTAGQGYAGGLGDADGNGGDGGGGGGAGSVGQSKQNGYIAGDGGLGLASTINGASVLRAGGGGAGGYSRQSGYDPGSATAGAGAGAAPGAGTAGYSATANSGSGGGGGGDAGGSGGLGGSGIVIIRYPITDPN